MIIKCWCVCTVFAALSPLTMSVHYSWLLLNYHKSSLYSSLLHIQFLYYCHFHCHFSLEIGCQNQAETLPLSHSRSSSAREVSQFHRNSNVDARETYQIASSELSLFLIGWHRVRCSDRSNIKRWKLAWNFHVFHLNSAGNFLSALLMYSQRIRVKAAYKELLSPFANAAK